MAEILGTSEEEVVSNEADSENAIETEKKIETKEEKAERLINEIANNDWQQARESERLKERYGDVGAITTFRAWLGGEYDFTYDSETGEARHNVLNEVGRRSTNVLWKATRTAGLVAGIGLLTGGAAAIPAGAILGSSLGRGFCEAWRGFSGAEGKLRRELIAERYKSYKELEELASEIAEDRSADLTGEELEQYQRQRNEKIEKLINLTDKPEKKLVIEKQNKLDEYVSKWKKIEDILAFVGGMAGGITNYVQLKHQILSGLKNNLDSSGVSLDLNGDGIFHNVMKIDQGVKEAHHLCNDYVFGYNSPAEVTSALSDQATVLEQGQHGSHILERHINIPGVLNRIASEQSVDLRYPALFAVIIDGALASKFRGLTDKKLEKYQKNLQSSSLDYGTDKKVVAGKETKLERTPEKGEIWKYQTKKGKEIEVEIIDLDNTNKDLPLLTIKTTEGTSAGKQIELSLAEFFQKGATYIGKKSEKIDEVTTTKAREASKYTIGKVEDYSELNADTLEAGDEKFKEITKEIWDKFAVHGTLEYDKAGKRFIVKNGTDLDGRGAIGLFKLAGFNTEELSFVNHSDYAEGRVNLDTGDQDGVTYYENGDKSSLFFDHHAKDSAKDYSATSLVYDTLIEMGFLKEDAKIRNAINFIVDLDNCRYALDQESYIATAGNLYGLGQYLTFEKLLEFFDDGLDPNKTLTADELKKYGLEERLGQQKSNVENSIKYLKIGQEAGFELESARYGRIYVDYGKKLPGSFNAVRAYGYNTYIIWNPKTNSFFISSDRPITDEFTGGKIIRQHMCIKPRHDRSPLKITLGEILSKMTDGKVVATKSLAKYLEKEKTVTENKKKRS